MFRQKRKQRYEIAAHVEQLTDGMTARDLTEHLRFWKIITKWDPEPNANKDFIIAVERRLKNLTKEEGKPGVRVYSHNGAPVPMNYGQ